MTDLHQQLAAMHSSPSSFATPLAHAFAVDGEHGLVYWREPCVMLLTEEEYRRAVAAVLELRRTQSAGCIEAFSRSPTND